jgi:two-component system response regulator HydG
VELEQVAQVSATVLVRGESGTGKERVARLIHEKSPRARGPWIALNCAALPENLIESELFGHEKGAFTGAQQSHAGLFEAASGGTLFLDEIGDMPLALQSRLLRTLQEGEVRRLGSTASKKVDVRVIAATHRDLHECVRLGSFRPDLLFRLEVLTLDVPPLRAREGDIELLAAHFLSEFMQRHGKAIAGCETVFLHALRAHAWPGNVRELQNVMERAVVFGREHESLGLEALPDHLRALEGVLPVGTGATSWDDTIAVRIGTPLREVEDLLIRRTLEATEGDKAVTAQLLGINARTIYRKLEKWSSEEEAPEGRPLEPSVTEV